MSLALCGLFSGCDVRSGEARSAFADGGSTAPSAPLQDSILLARRYGTLSRNVADLKLEMWSRTTGAVLREFRWTPPTGPRSFGAQPVTRDYPLPAAAVVPVNLDRTPRASAQRRRTKVEVDAVRPAFEQWARASGFRVTRGTSAADTANAIVFGDSVALADVRAVALQLYNTRTPARSIRRFAEGEGDARTIRLRYNPLFEGVPPLSAAQIRALRLPRADEN